MPRRAVGLGRAVTAPTAARVAGRAVGVRDLFRSTIRVASTCAWRACQFATHETQREDS
jgi:hypothetical protein